MGSHSRHSSPWRQATVIGVLVGAAWAIGHYSQPEQHIVPVSEQEAVNQAARLGQDVVGQCNVNPSSLSTQICGDAAQVVASPVHDGKDGKDGRNGMDGLNGIDGKNGHDGRDGSDVKAQIFHHADGTTEYCPRAGGSDLYPVYNCVNAKVVTKSSQ